MKFEAIVFDQLPMHDTCWSLSTGVDGMVYIGVCGEMTGGLSAYLAAYDPARQQLQYLLEVAAAVGCPADNGRPTHGKIHYGLLPGEDGLIYAATHCTCPPLHDYIWRPFHTWSASDKAFTGSKFFVFDPKANKVLFTDDLVPRQSTRCMALNQSARLVYGITYPQNHFFIYDLARRQTRDLGRIGSVNPQCLFLDRAGNGYTANDYGFLIKYDPAADQLRQLDVQIPHAPFRDGYHAVPYDAVAAPDGAAVYGVTWDYNVRLFRYFPEASADGRLEDLGRAYGPETTEWGDIKDDHVGGLVFGLDGKLYFAMNLSRVDRRSHLISLDPDTLERKDLGAIHDGDLYPDHISRATRDYEGNLYFADVGMRPTKIFKYRPDYAAPVRAEKGRVIRSWG